MNNTDIIPVTPIETIQALVARAEREAPPPAPAAARVPARGTRFPEGTLGPIDMARYLQHYGIKTLGTKPTSKGGGTMHILDVCLFNPDHRPGQASIVTWPDGISYQCFHSSCAHMTWKDARRVISGEDKLAEFCAGYDPNWKKTPKLKAAKPVARGELTGAYRDLVLSSPIVAQSRVDRSTGAVTPSPLDVNEAEFYELKGKRTELVPRYVANYLYLLLQPVAYNAGQIWRYADGVWKVRPKEEIAAIIVAALKNKIQARTIENVMAIFGYLTYRPEELWDQNPYLLNVKNGMYDINAGKLVSHDPSYYSRVQLPVTYDPDGANPYPVWSQFLADIFPEDFERDSKGLYTHHLSKQFLLQQFCGYLLLRDTRFQKALFLYGGGSNGKSTLLNVVGAVLGGENTVSLSLTSLGERFKAQYLHNKLANMASETNPKLALESDIFNAVVAGDEITAEKKYGDAFPFRAFCKFIISMNEPPVVQDKSYAFQRRVLVLNFTRRFLKEEIDPAMTDKLIAEKDGIFYWMVEGLKMILQKNGFVVGANIQEEIDQMMERVNPFLTFCEECTRLGTDEWTPTMDLWEAYRDWCDEAGLRKLGRNKFFDQVLSQFPAVTKAHSPDGARRAFLGMGIRLASVDEMRARLNRRTKTRG